MDKIVDKCQIIPFILWSDVNYENWRNALYFDIISDIITPALNLHLHFTINLIEHNKDAVLENILSSSAVT